MNKLKDRPVGQPMNTATVLREANRLLESRYGTPRLGNKRHPVSELVFIILSARTRGRHHEAIYRNLRRRFRDWEAVRDAPLREIERVIHDAGLSRIKARQIKTLLRQLSNDFGSLSAAPLRRMDTDTLERYLAHLPGVGLKTARCVMMYALDRRVFPVDTHCLRLFQNLGLIEGRMRFEYAQDPLQATVPDEIRKTLHVNTVAHGRETCVPRAERCYECVIAHLCRNRH
jgi:endonuclease-3